MPCAAVVGCRTPPHPRRPATVSPGTSGIHCPAAIRGRTTGRRGVRSTRLSGLGELGSGGVLRRSRDDRSGLQPFPVYALATVRSPEWGTSGGAGRSCRPHGQDELVFQPLRIAPGRPGAARQGGQPGSQGRVQTLNERRVDGALLALGHLDQVQGPEQVPKSQTALNPLAVSSLYDLDRVPFGPLHQPRASTMSVVKGSAEEAQHLGLPGRDPVGRPQDGGTEGAPRGGRAAPSQRSSRRSAPGRLSPTSAAVR